MTRIDQIIADALAGSPETHVAMLAREVVRLREARAVVVPELTEGDENRARRDWQRNSQLGTIRFGYDLAASRARAIPADRVLGDGMVAVSREEWKHIVTLLAHLLCDEDAYEKADSLLEPIAKMREIRDGKAWIGIMVSDALGVSTPEIDDFFACPPSALCATKERPAC